MMSHNELIQSAKEYASAHPDYRESGEVYDVPGLARASACALDDLDQLTVSRDLFVRALVERFGSIRALPHPRQKLGAWLGKAGVRMESATKWGRIPEFTLSVNSNIWWENGDFHEFAYSPNGSCYWGMYKHARAILSDHCAGVFRAITAQFNDSGENFFRVFTVEFEDDTVLVFNVRSHPEYNVETSDVAELFALLTGAVVRRFEGSVWIGDGYVSPDPSRWVLDYDYRPTNFSLVAEVGESVRVNDTYSAWVIDLQDEWNPYIGKCEGCGDLCPIEEMKIGLYCRTCAPSYRCMECGEYFDDRDLESVSNVTDHDSQDHAQVCADCIARNPDKYRECEECSLLFMVTEEGEGDLCPICRDDDAEIVVGDLIVTHVFKCAHCGRSDHSEPPAPWSPYRGERRICAACLYQASASFVPVSRTCEKCGKMVHANFMAGVTTCDACFYGTRDVFDVERPSIRVEPGQMELGI